MVRKPINSRGDFRRIHGIRDVGDSRGVSLRQSAKGWKIRVFVRQREVYGDTVGDQVFIYSGHWSPSAGTQVHNVRQGRLIKGMPQQRDHRVGQVEPSLDEVQVVGGEVPDCPREPLEIFEFEELQARQWHLFYD